MASVNYLLEIVEEKQIVEIVEDGEALSQQVFIVETGPIEIIEIVDRGLQGDKGDPGDDSSEFYYLESTNPPTPVSAGARWLMSDTNDYAVWNGTVWIDIN